MKKRTALGPIQDRWVTPFSFTVVNDHTTERQALCAQLRQELLLGLKWGYFHNKIRQNVAPTEEVRPISSGLLCEGGLPLESLESNPQLKGNPALQALVQEVITGFSERIYGPFEIACVGYRYDFKGSAAAGNPLNWHRDLHMKEGCSDFADWTSIYYLVSPGIYGGALNIQPADACGQENITVIQPQDSMLLFFDNKAHRHAVEPVGGSLPADNRTTLIFTAKKC